MERRDKINYYLDLLKLWDSAEPVCADIMVPLL